MKLIDEIKDNLKKIDSSYDWYFILMYVSNVYTGILDGNGNIRAYSDKEEDLPSDDTFMEGYVFNEDGQLTLYMEDGKRIVSLFTKKDMDGLRTIDERMFLLSDDKIDDDQISKDHVTLHQGNKTVIVPKHFTKEQVRQGLVLVVRNYIDFDENQFPYVKQSQLLGYDFYKEGEE